MSDAETSVDVPGEHRGCKAVRRVVGLLDHLCTRAALVFA